MKSACPLQGGDIGRRQGPSAIHVSRMLVQRPATGLALRLDDPIAVHPQGSLGGFVHVAEERIHHAAAEESDGRWDSGTGGQRSSTRRRTQSRPAAPPTRYPAGLVLPLLSLLGHLRRGCQHAHPEPEPPLPGQEAGQTGGPKRPGQGEQRVARSSHTERHPGPAAPGRRDPERG